MAAAPETTEAAPQEREEVKDGVEVCLFDESPEGFSKAVRAISELAAGEPEPAFPDADVERFASSITFLREWRHFSYEPKVVSFNFEDGSTSSGDETYKIMLPQFSSAAAPQITQQGDERDNVDRSDFVLFAGGNVWAMDWCPRLHGKPCSSINSEYLAVAAHPPGSSYHKLGMPLIGRGIIQVWCLIAPYEEVQPHDLVDACNYSSHRGRPKKTPDVGNSFENASNPPKPRGRPRKGPITASDDHSEPSLKRPRGRPRKCALSVAKVEDSSQNSKSQDFCLTDPPTSRVVPGNLASSSAMPSMNPVESTPKKCRGRPRKHPIDKIKGSSSIALEEDLSTAPVSTAVMCMEPKRKRGRPRKYPVQSNNNHISILDIELRQDTTCLPVSVDCSSGHIDYTDSNANLSVLSVDSALPAPSSSSAICEKKSRGQRHGGQPEKEPISRAFCCSVASCVEAQNTGFGQTISNDPAISVNDASPAHPLCNASCKEESSVKRGRGRPRKKPVSTEYSFSMTFSGEEQMTQTAPMHSKSNDHVASVENPISFGRSGEDMASNHGSASPVHLSPNANCKKESHTRKGREPKKKSASTESSSVVFGGEAEKMGRASTPIMSHNHLASVENATPLGSSKSEDVSNEASSIRLMSGVRGCKVMKVNKSNTTNYTFGYNIETEPANQAASVPFENSARLTDEVDNRDLAVFKQELRKDDHMICCTDKHSPIPKDIALPRIVLCLAHNGKVAWDIKWKPPFPNQSEQNSHLGYLAILLGNGSLEVWEVPSPTMVQKIYYSSSMEGADPRFLKLQPVFRCASVKCGNRQSIPLTVDWSPCPHDMILAGCHDGTVALWKFSTSSTSLDSKPLVCFTAESVPIRALSWAPYVSEENTNLFVTAGEDGLKFWDLRDPYRPLWEIATTPRAVLSLDWLKDARCIVISLEDGTLKFLSLSRSANDVPTTGTLFLGTKTQGVFSYQLSKYLIWSVHVSRTTGRAAYCVADGTAVHFQLTPKFWEKESSRNRVPYFLCGSLSEKGSVLKINSSLQNSPLSNIPLVAKKGPKLCQDTDQVHNTDKDKIKNLIDPEFGDTLVDEPDEGKETGPIILASGTKQENVGIRSIRDAESPKDSDIFPPKVVSLHRLRWNMNKGCERWLCYGGAAGIVRCQKI